MPVVTLLFLLVTVASMNAAPSDSLTFEVLAMPSVQTRAKDDDDLSQAKSPLNPVDEKKESNSATRHKKSATTTFCVEIRPGDPHQKPYEVCESGNHIYTVPIESNSDYKALSSSYSSSSVQSGSHSYVKPAYSAPKPSPSYTAPSSAAYSASIKTESSYPKGNSYGSYRSGDEFEEGEEIDGFEQVSNEMAERSEEMNNMHALRSAGYGYGNAYGYGYGGGYGESSHGPTLIKFKGAGKKKKKNKDKDHDDSMEHHGVVITCQPSLAGYASGIGGPIGGGGMAVQHGGEYGGYGGYRSAYLEGRSSPKYRSKYYNAGSSGGGGYPGHSGTYGYGGEKHRGFKSYYGGPSHNMNDDGYYSPHNYNGARPQYDDSGFSPMSSTSSSSAYDRGSGYISGGSQTHGNSGYSHYPVYPSYTQSHSQNHYAPPPPIQPPYPPSQAPASNTAAAYHGYNPSRPMPSGYSAAAAASSSASYSPPGTYRTSESSPDNSMMNMKMDTKEKEMERATSTVKHDDKDKTSAEGMNKMMHSRSQDVWNGNMRASSGQNGEMHHQEDMKQNHQNHVGSGQKWAENENMNASTMTESKSKA